MIVKRLAAAGVPDDAASSLPELLLAAAVTLIGAGMVMGSIIAPVQYLGGLDEHTEERAALSAAADSLARVVRAAREGTEGPAAVAIPHGVRLRVERDGEIDWYDVVIDGGVLSSSHQVGAGGLGTAPLEQLIDGLESGSSVALMPEVGPPRGVVIQLITRGGEVVRLVPVRVIR